LSFINRVNAFSLMRQNAGLLIVLALITTIILDSFLLRTYDLYSKASSIVWSVPVFITISTISILAQFSLLVILRTNKVKTKSSGGNRKTPNSIITVIQLLLAANLIICVILIVTQSFYPITILIFGVTLSYGITASNMVILTIRFAKWFRSRGNLELLLYGISAISIVVSAVITLLFSDLTLSHLPANVKFRIGGSGIYIPPDTPEEKLARLNYILVPISFFLTWVAIVTILRGYRKKHGFLRFWIVISIPLLIFMSQYFVQLFKISENLIVTDPVFYGSLFTLAFIFTKLSGGILFGLTFWIIGRNIPGGKTVRDYLVMAAYGNVLLLISIQILGIIIIPYPPFGILTISIAGLSSYFVLMGIYGSAITLTENAKLRSEIRKTVTRSGFLESIGSAQLEYKIEKEVTNISKNFQTKLLEETGVRLDMDEGDVRDYVNEVISEIKKR